MIEELERRLKDHAVNRFDLKNWCEIERMLSAKKAQISLALSTARRYKMLTATGATRTSKNAARAGLFAALDELERGE